MIQKILFTLCMMPAVGLATVTNFECVTETGDPTRVAVQLNYQELKTSGKMWTRGQVQLQASGAEEKFCGVFQVLKNFKRAGYVQTFQSQLPNGTLLSLTEEAFHNEGPAEFSHGSVKAAKAAEAVKLSCTKSL